MRDHNQCISAGNVSYVIGRGTVWHIARWKALVVVQYDRLSNGTKVESSTPSSDEVYFISDLGKVCDFLRIQLLKDDIKFFFKSENKNGP
jgi:hypothetical protein